MEHTYERRRNPSGSGTRQGRHQAMDPRERRRLIQLGVSAGLFLLVFFGRGLLGAERLADWKDRLGRDVDFKSAFSQLGASLSQGVPVKDALGGLWVEVFAGEPVPSARPCEGWEKLPTLSKNMVRQLTDPKDPVGRWAVEAAKLWEEKQKQASEQSGAEVSPTAAEGAVLVLRPLAATAQATDAQGRKLPERVSLEYYDLGLKNTVLPVSAPLTSGFGFREGPLTGGEDFHLGVDLGAVEGTNIAAYADGVVIFAGENRTYGDYIRLDHGGGVVTIYAHCSKLLVEQGQTVSAGETIAKVGHTGDAAGAHLHFAVQKNSIFLDPLHYIAPPT